jgi:plastocyanin
MTDVTTTDPGSPGADDAEAGADDAEAGAHAGDAEVEAADAADGADGAERDEQRALLPGGIPEDPVKDRLLIPLLLPFLSMIAIALYTLNVSRVFLAGGSTIALGIAAGITISILAGGALISASPRLRTSSLVMVMGLVLVIVVSAGLLTLGPSLESGEGGGGPLPQPSGPAASTVTVAAQANITYNASDYPAKAGTVEIDLTGASGHTLQFREITYQGFPLSTSGGPSKGKVTLKPGQYNIYCTITGHAATMHATITVT